MDALMGTERVVETSEYQSMLKLLVVVEHKRSKLKRADGKRA